MNFQPQSPLFSTIPPEIRNHIFWLVLQEYDDPTKSYPRESYYTRPGCLCERRVDTELLRTCKIVYAETKAIPLQNTEVQVYLGGNERAPPYTGLELPALVDVLHVISTGVGEEALSYSYLGTKYSKLSPEQWSRIKAFRFFVPLCKYTPQSLEAFFYKRLRATWPSAVRYLRAPELVTICVRYTDWWDWELNAPLKLSSRYWKRITFPASVKRVVLELETADVGTRRSQLDTIVHDLLARLDDCAYKREDGKVLDISDEKGVREWVWQGPTTFGNREIYAHHPKGDTMQYVVKALEWEVVE